MKTKPKGDFFADYNNEDTALIVNKGVDNTHHNPYVKSFYRKKPSLLCGSIYGRHYCRRHHVLSQAITLIESSLAEHRELARKI